MKLKFFDLHCDTIQKIFEKGCDFSAVSGLHLNLPGIRSANLSASALESQGKTAVIIVIKVAIPLMGRVERLEHFYKRGVRLLTIAWDDNEFCGTVFGNNSGMIGLVFGSGFISPEYYQYERANRDRIIKGLKNKIITFKDAGKITRKALGGLKNAPVSLLVEHAKHMIRIGGEDCLGLGSDFDGVNSLP